MSRKDPLLNVSLCYFAGMLTGSAINPAYNLIVVACSTSAIACAAMGWIYSKSPVEIKNRMNERLFHSTILLSFFLLAQLNLSLCGYHYKITKITSFPSGKMKYTKMIIEDVIKRDSNKTIANAFNIDYQERIRLNFKNNNLEIEQGDTILGTVYIYPVLKNTEAKGFAKYLALDDIYSIGHIYPKTYRVAKEINCSKIFSIREVKKAYKNFINSIVKDKKRVGVIIALTTGYKGEIESDVVRSFSASGTMHLMAVSGLHVGFIHTILTWIFIILGRKRMALLLKSSLIISIIWTYAVFTDLQPSILRASIMVSCLEISKITSRVNHSLNSLAFASLMICIIDPLAFFSVGFRLSFAATLSIIIFQPIIYKLFIPKNIAEKYVWSSLSLSLCCQLGTLPLTLYYFGSFPTYFLLANLITIPLSALTIVSVLATILFQNTFMSGITVYALEFFSTGLVWVVNTIESLPYSTLNIK